MYLRSVSSEQMYVRANVIRANIFQPNVFWAKVIKPFGKDLEDLEELSCEEKSILAKS
jgi:hypothetical protein